MSRSPLLAPAPESPQPKTSGAVSRPVSYAGALQPTDTTRAAVLARFRAAGGDRDAWRVRDRTLMADALTRAEDELELRAGSRAAAERSAIRVVRRALEGDG